MLARGASGDLAVRLTDMDRTSSLPDEYFPTQSGLGSTPQSAVYHREPVLRVSSGPGKGFTRSSVVGAGCGGAETCQGGTSGFTHGSQTR